MKMKNRSFLLIGSYTACLEIGATEQGQKKMRRIDNSARKLSQSSVEKEREGEVDTGLSYLGVKK